MRNTSSVLLFCCLVAALFLYNRNEQNVIQIKKTKGVKSENSIKPDERTQAKIQNITNVNMQATRDSLTESKFKNDSVKSKHEKLDDCLKQIYGSEAGFNQQVDKLILKLGNHMTGDLFLRRELKKPKLKYSTSGPITIETLAYAGLVQDSHVELDLAKAESIAENSFSRERANAANVVIFAMILERQNKHEQARRVLEELDFSEYFSFYESDLNRQIWENVSSPEELPAALILTEFRQRPKIMEFHKFIVDHNLTKIPKLIEVSLNEPFGLSTDLNILRNETMRSFNSDHQMILNDEFRTLYAKSQPMELNRLGKRLIQNCNREELQVALQEAKSFEKKFPRKENFHKSNIRNTAAFE